MASPMFSCSSTSSSSSNSYIGAYVGTHEISPPVTRRERTLVERVVTSQFAQSVLKDSPEWNTTRQHLCSYPNSPSLTNNSFFLITQTHVAVSYFNTTQHTKDKADLVDPNKAKEFEYCQIFYPDALSPEMCKTVHKTHDRSQDDFRYFSTDRSIPGKNISNFYTCTLNRGTNKELVLHYRFLNRRDMPFVKDVDYLPSPISQCFFHLNQLNEYGIEFAKKIYYLNLQGLSYSACRIIATYLVGTEEPAGLPFYTSTYGSKHDRLVDLQTTVPIPQFFGFSHDQIYGLLSEETKKLWAQLKNNPYLLSEIRYAVGSDIRASTLPLTQDQKKLLADLKGKVLIVRSSSNEDGATLNAGGNESVPNVEAEETALKMALVTVVRSYFSEKSFKNRSAFEDPYSKFPQCSVLVMEQIVENNNDPTSISSGVMMTSKKGWSAPAESGIAYITASWGFGSGTSNMMACDEWIIADGHIYASVRQKVYSNKPSLSLQQVEKLQEMAKQIEAKFKHPMDVEFVVKGDEIYIVQARPMQEPHIKKMTYLDPEVSSLTKQYQGQMIVSGLNQALFLKERDELCFAPDLESAETSFNPKLHKAVVVYTPESSNTHPAGNFASYQPPIPCLVLPYEKYEECRKSHSLNFQLCPQTGLLVETHAELPVREGLFLHPAQLTFDDQEECSNKDIEVLKELLKGTPEVLISRMKVIEEQLKSVPIDEKFQKNCLYELEAMKNAIKHKQMTRLAFHAGMLRQLARAATPIPKAIQDFIGRYKNSTLLCELASLGTDGFDEEVQDMWLKFLEEKHDEKKLQQLLKDLEGLKTIGMITEWFSLSFFPSDLDQLLSQNAGLLKTAPVAHKVKSLSESLAKANSLKDLQHIWEALEKVTEEFFQLKVKCPLFINLIDLWDMSTKKVRTLYLDKDHFKGRVDAFEKFVKLANAHGFLNYSLSEVFRALDEGWGRDSHAFSVQHWLTPISHGALATISTDDQRLTVLHQNLLQAAAFGNTESLPLKLFTFYNIFNDKLILNAKRFSGNKGTFISVGKSQASIRINIPLNYHSSIVTLNQKKGSGNCEVTFYMRASDNWRGKHLDFFVMFSHLAGITVKNSTIISSDLKIVFSIEKEAQASLLSRAINHINAISIGGNSSTKRSLQWVFDPDEKNSKEIDTQIWMYLWEKLKKTGILLDADDNTQQNLYRFLKNNNQLDELVNRVIEELVDEKPESDFMQFTKLVLKNLPNEKCEAIVWRNLTKGHSLSPYEIPKNALNNLLKRLFEEQFAKAKEYYKKKAPYYREELGIFIELMNAKLKAGGIKTCDEIELLFWMAFYYKHPIPEHWIKALKEGQKDVQMIIDHISDYNYDSNKDKFHRLEVALGIKKLTGNLFGHGG